MQGRRSQQSKSTAEDNLNCNGKQVISLDKVINTDENQKQQKTKKQQKEISTKKQNSTNTEDLSGVSIKESQNGAYNLRQYTRRNYLDFGSEAGGDDNNDIDFGVKKQLNKERKNSDLDINETIEYDKLPKNKQGLLKLLSKVEASIESQKLEWFKEQNELPTLTSSVPENSIPINADVLSFNFKSLIASQQKIAGKLFDAIMMDPPWQLSTSQPSRGVAIAYQSLKDDQLMELPIPLLQKEGFLFIWTINAKYRIAAKMMKQWGYQLVDELIWVKKTVNGKIAKGHGFYLYNLKSINLYNMQRKIALLVIKAIINQITTQRVMLSGVKEEANLKSLKKSMKLLMQWCLEVIAQKSLAEETILGIIGQLLEMNYDFIYNFEQHSTKFNKFYFQQFIYKFQNDYLHSYSTKQPTFLVSNMQYN